MNRTFSHLFVSILLIAGLVSCGGSRAAQTTSGLTFRAFVSNPVNLTITGGNAPGLNIIDATQDLLSPASVSLLGTVSSAGMMVESPKRDRTIVFSPTTQSSTSNALAIVENAREGATGSVTLPGATESMFVTSDSNTLYAAIPSAAENGQSSGAVVQINLGASTPAITATVPVPGAHFIIPTPTGNQILILSDTANSATILAPALLNTGNALTPVTGAFDKPVWAVFSSDGSTAYVMNCGPECGGTSASVAVIEMATASVSSVVPVAAATVGLLSGGNLYVAGTPLSSTNCQSNLCGVLSVFPSVNVSAAPSTFPITDGYHNNLVQAPNNQLFIGSRICTDVIASGSTPGRGCLSVFNSATGKVYTEAQNGDVTGIQAIDKRTVVYVCEGGTLQIYDTASDLGAQGQLQLQTTQITITGQAIDVKLVDF